MTDFDQDDSENEEGAPIDVIAQLAEARGWSYSYSGDDELAVTIAGSWASYELRAVWRADDQVLQILLLPDVKVADDKRIALYETIGLINEQLWLGHFELWSNSGILLFRHGILVGNADGISTDNAEVIIDAAIDECERFYPVFQFVLWGGKTPQEAITASMIETQGEA